LRAVALWDEANRMSAQWTLTVSVDPVGTATVILLAGSTPVPGRAVTLHVSGSDLPLAVTTGADGSATAVVPLVPGTTTVVATTEGPGRALVYRGWPASPDPDGAQFLVTAGTPATLRAEAALAPPPTTVPATTTTSAATTTTTATTTTVSQSTTTSTSAPTTTAATTTTSAPATTIAPTTLVPPDTTPETTPATVPDTTPVTFFDIPTSDVPLGTMPDLPETGQGTDGAVPFVATALLVSGIGLVGTLRRRGGAPYTR
jgi:hypothetical protein